METYGKYEIGNVRMIYDMKKYLQSKKIERTRTVPIVCTILSEDWMSLNVGLSFFFVELYKSK